MEGLATTYTREELRVSYVCCAELNVMLRGCNLRTSPEARRLGAWLLGSAVCPVLFSIPTTVSSDVSCEQKCTPHND